ncbi:helix-turn-helix transcriptional regulator [Pseudomonas tussilaginis]|uniref:helix-turn-helix transcriptional regulator n=1 Tax=Pseudomonas putida TaxID=303 RepID=UPI00236355B8|nr:LuxR C-terminal-related transcriptional regulator [Pseudomonas putida]MDD1977538.1 LuxR C-terminal-related transcriptional regulator [Pseudomonas putida]
MIRLSIPQVSTLPQDIRHFSELACTLGTPSFPGALLTCLGQWADCQHFSVLRMAGERPQLLVAGTRHHDAGLVLRCGQVYIERYHRHDPLFEPLKAAPGQVGHLLAQDIRFMPYREAIYLRHGMIERLSSVYLDEQERPVLFNLYRHRDQGFFSDRELQMCEALSPALLQLLRGHLALTGLHPIVDHPQRLLQHCPELTAQELNICSRLLQGMTHAGIAADLGLKESTVKTYRNRAFDRLGINFPSQLFALIASSAGGR